MAAEMLVVVNFIKHQNRAITGERVAARAAPSYQYAMVLVIPLYVLVYYYMYLVPLLNATLWGDEHSMHAEKLQKVDFH